MSVALAVIDASVGETPAETNLRRELDADVTVYKISEGQRPPPMAAAAWQFDGVVISGSQTSVYDDYDWIHEATEWVRRVHRAGIPVLGICWGHQLLAQALGGRVVDMGTHELGYEQIVRLGADPLFEGIPATFTSFETHTDRVAELPSDAVALARNEYGIQAFRLDHTYGVQFHPEYDRETAVWVTEGKDLPDDRRRSVLDGITDESVEAARQSTQLFDNFRRLVETRRPVQQP
jgi:GMP synthase (glutamine-hydrolysing)